MMKLSRSALMAGLVAIGVGACGDDVQIVEPTPPPPPPLTATMLPGSATVAVGNNVVFAVNASGGAAGAQASWTCASSNTGIATVSNAGAGCQATGVAAGGVTITAAVTKGSETINVGAQLTVTTEEEAAGEPAFIFISDIGDTDGVVVGNAEVTISIERGDQVFIQLSVLVDGVVVSTLPFGVTPAMAAPEDEPAAQAVHAFTLSFNSAEYNAVTGEPTYMNGEHTISAVLMVVGSDEPIGSGIHTVEFGNNDGYVVTADLGDNRAIGDDGRQWYGGPDNGTIDITALPVSYSGGSVTSVSANFCKEDATDSDGADGYTFEFECADRESSTDGTGGAVAGDMLTISSAGTDGKILNDDHPFPAFVDFVGPSESPIIVANRNGRENGWLNAAVALTGEVDADEEDDENWLVKGADVTGGIGGYNMMLLMGENLEKALEASPSSSLPAESADKDSYCAVALATDDLGNESERPDAKGTCRAAPDGADFLVTVEMEEVYGADVDDLSGQTLEFRVDVTAPTIAFGDDYGMRFAQLTDADGVGDIAFDSEDDANDVGNSGLDGDKGLQVGVRRRTASKTECLTVGADGAVGGPQADDKCATMALVTVDDINLATDAADAYYTVSATAQDKAGNSSDAVSHTFVYDATEPSATPPAVPGVIAAGTPFGGATYLNDNLSIRDYYGHAAYGTEFNLGIGLPIDVDGFDAASLTNLNHPVSATVGILTASGALPPYKTLQTGAGDNPKDMSGVAVFVRDQASVYYSESSPVFPTGAPKAGGDELFAAGAFTVAWEGRNTSAMYEVCALPGGCGGEDEKDFPTSLKVEVRAIAPASGTFRNPFARVDFWVTDVNGTSWYVGSDASGTSGRVGGTKDNARWRAWSYSVTLPGALVGMATRAGISVEGVNTVLPMIRAVAVNDENVGLVQASPVVIGTEKP